MSTHIDKAISHIGQEVEATCQNIIFDVENIAEDVGANHNLVIAKLRKRLDALANLNNALICIRKEES